MRRLFALAAVCAAQVPTTSYRAGVVEFSPALCANNSLDRAAAVGCMRQNLAQYDSLAAAAAANGTQILVFPEYGIYGDGTVAESAWTRAGILPFGEPVPDVLSPPAVLCGAGGAQGDDGPATITTALSCLAKARGLALVADLADKVRCSSGPGCRADGYRLYNTAVAFGADGAYLAKYHKNHLFGDESRFFESGIGGRWGNRSTFVVPGLGGAAAGVEFGMFICFDILWEGGWGPSGVRNFVFPTDWVNARPFEKATEAQTAWSLAAGANLLAANYGGFGEHSSGSGIYHKGQALAKFFNPTKEPGTKMLIVDVPLL